MLRRLVTKKISKHGALTIIFFLVIFTGIVLKKYQVSILAIHSKNNRKLLSIPEYSPKQ